MTESRSDRLLRELLALYVRYGEADFQRAVEALESGRAFELVGKIARLRSATVKRIKQPENRASAKELRSSRDRFEDYLSVLRSRSDLG